MKTIFCVLFLVSSLSANANTAGPTCNLVCHRGKETINERIPHDENAGCPAQIGFGKCDINKDCKVSCTEGSFHEAVLFGE